MSLDLKTAQLQKHQKQISNPTPVKMMKERMKMYDKVLFQKMSLKMEISHRNAQLIACGIAMRVMVASNSSVEKVCEESNEPLSSSSLRMSDVLNSEESPFSLSIQM